MTLRILLYEPLARCVRRSRGAYGASWRSASRWQVRTSHATSQVPRVFEAILKSTLDMITKNFEDFLEHRLNLFSLLRAINHHCFPALLTEQVLISFN